MVASNHIKMKKYNTITVKLMPLISNPSAHLDGTYIQYFAFAVTNYFADIHRNDR